MRRSRRQRLLLPLLLAAACDGSGPVASEPGRVLLVGLDAATLRVVEPLLQEGRLPNLARLADEGVHGPLQAFLPPQSRRIWATIATGKAPEKHGIQSFTRPRPGGSTALHLGSDRRVHALWNVTSDRSLHRRRHPPPPIASHDTKPIERVATGSRELRALGYVE